jgi:hypothetical protein
VIECNNPAHGTAIATLTSTPFTPGLDSCISRSRAGRLLGGVIYQQFLKRSIVIHVAGFDPHGLSRDLLWAIFDYPFNRLGVEQILGFVPTTNTRALEFDKKIGFKPVTRIPDVVPGGDMIVISMRRNECRWLAYNPRGLMTPEPEMVYEQQPVRAPATELSAPR